LGVKKGGENVHFLGAPGDASLHFGVKIPPIYTVISMPPPKWGGTGILSKMTIPEGIEDPGLGRPPS